MENWRFTNHKIYYTGLESTLRLSQIFDDLWRGRDQVADGWLCKFVTDLIHITSDNYCIPQLSTNFYYSASTASMMVFAESGFSWYHHFTAWILIVINPGYNPGLSNPRQFCAVHILPYICWINEFGPIPANNDEVYLSKFFRKSLRLPLFLLCAACHFNLADMCVVHGQFKLESPGIKHCGHRYLAKGDLC